MGQVTYTMLFRWFVGRSMDGPVWNVTVWDVTVLTKSRERLQAGDIAVPFLLAVMSDPAVKRQLSTEHYSVDGTLIEGWASMKSFRRKAARMSRLPAPAAMPSGISAARTAATRPTPRRPTPTPGCIASPTASHRGCASWAIC